MVQSEQIKPKTLHNRTAFFWDFPLHDLPEKPLGQEELSSQPFHGPSKQARRKENQQPCKKNWARINENRNDSD